MSKKKLIKTLTALSLCLCSVTATSACELPFLPNNNTESSSTMKSDITITVPEFTAPVSLIHDEVALYMQADASELVTSYLPADNTRCDQGQPVTFQYRTEQTGNASMKKARIEFSFTEDFKNIEHVEHFTSVAHDLKVYNLQTGKQYYFRLTATFDNDTVATTTGSLETAASPRFIRLNGASNVRDIGGWKTEDGKTVKQGLLYRGGEIDGGKNTGHADFCLTTKGIQQLRALGIKTDFDLRSESNKVGEYSILGEDVSRTFYNAEQYEAITLPINAEKERKIFSDLAKPESYPIYLHCTHGVDRAGSTSLILEALLGVSKEDLIRDYELSAFYYNYKHVNREYDQNGGSVLGLIAALEEYDGESFKDKVASFLLSIGVTQAEIDSIRNIFLG